MTILKRTYQYEDQNSAEIGKAAGGSGTPRTSAVVNDRAVEKAVEPATLVGFSVAFSKSQNPAEAVPIRRQLRLPITRGFPELAHN